MPSLHTVQSSGGQPGRGAPRLRCHSGPHGKSLHPLLPPGKRGDDNTAPRNLNPQTESEDTAMRAKGPRDGVSAARVGGLVRGRAEPRPGPGVTGGRPTWAMADSQRLMLSVWRKCKPVACKGEREPGSSSRGALRAEPRPRPAGSRSWGSWRRLPRGRDRRRPTDTTGWVSGRTRGSAAHRRGSEPGTAGLGQDAGAGRGAGARGAQPGGGVCLRALLLGAWGIPEPARPVSLAATDNVQRLAGSRHPAR